MCEVVVDLGKSCGEIDPKIFGHFTEHAFGNIYGGFYDPGNKLSDENGYRTDVLERVKQVKPHIMRYPGGNFVSNYHWEDGIGPKQNRKRVFEYAWLTEESNQFGTAEFIEVCRRVGAEPYLCVNLGTGTVEEAMHWVEYCNSSGNTYYANLRRAHGYEEPFGVKYWGLGNEMYGAWQMCGKSAEDYAKIAFECAKAMKWVDPGIKLVACGFEQDADWNYTVLRRLYPIVDYISAHHYSVGWGPFDSGDYSQTMYIPEYMQKLNDITIAALRTAANDNDCHVKVAWDEWNFFGWAVDGVNEERTYTMQDAVVTALILNMFLKNNDSIGMANYSTFVNINGCIGVKEDGLVLRPQYHVFGLLANNMGSRRVAVDVACDTFPVQAPRNPKMERAQPGIDLMSRQEHVEKTFYLPYLDSVATISDDNICHISLVNKHPDQDLEVRITLQGGATACGGHEVYTIFNEDLQAANTVEYPERVKIERASCTVAKDGAIVFSARKHSVNLLNIKLASLPSISTILRRINYDFKYY